MRLVVYAGSERIPTPIFNEKVLAGLGTRIEQTGRLAEDAREKALDTLKRFKLLVGHMKVRRTHVMATAAIRDAADGADFVREIDRIGFECEVLGAEDEAQLAGMGVLSGIPHADGLAGDLGGGSLELVEVGDGAVRGGVSLPLGVLRAEAGSSGEKAARKALKAALKTSGLREHGRGRSFYMVGGSWRALARIDMLTRDYPLPVTHEYSLAPKRIAELRRNATSPDAALAKIIAPARLATAPVAAMLLELLVEEIEPAELVVSTFGIREGLLYSKLKPAVRRLDPLLEEARESGGGEHRFGQHGDLLDEWIGDLFEDAPEMQRLRLAACLLADVAWQASPTFRADRGIEMALHGNWVAVSPTERVIIAQALSSSFGRDRLSDGRLLELCHEDDVLRAHEWGLAMRLGQRLSGGVSSVLKRTALRPTNGAIELNVRRGEEALVGEAVERRLVRLSEALGREPTVVSA
ncbi:Ppx/GppA family phosphatase [Sphingomonas hankyongi]|uniref:Ppx/GppA family phosphatase n=1 Tax=Sphingomonas hankyongi TaxID=2908209 RepID=A0ABT0S1P8_9SPHN|nr:Ppx/GppA family phosphatase [Sphingomonas hankyongi]